MSCGSFVTWNSRGLGRLPAVAFEVESSWRTRKHIKGDFVNPFDLGASLGVIVLLGAGEGVESTRRFARTLVDRPGARVAVWSETEVERSRRVARWRWSNPRARSATATRASTPESTTASGPG
jgi:hypothetical protein